MKRTFCTLWFLIGTILLTPLATTKAKAETARVAVAANFTTAAKNLVQAFENTTDHKIKLSFGSTGKIYAQISHGAPFDAFLSADSARPAQLIQQGLAEPSTQFTYAKGRLALYSRVLPITDVDISELLHGSDIEKIAIANPKTAPYGVATIEVLNAYQVHDALKNKIVMGDSISQTFQFTYSKNVSVGFVSASQLIGRTQGYSQLLPVNTYQPIHQDAVLLTRSQNNPAVLAFLEFLKSDTAKHLIRRFGYTID
ncbi:molybdate ABC transporter substrate-binding protein [Sessilibacter corallicola]|uniref:Molybdate ABC transporter substrate-binding protein n=1 Tax=Sessilibacter corallicola TaxID=2904075 RepID=A0ABQ0A412_9GAMM